MQSYTLLGTAEIPMDQTQWVAFWLSKGFQHRETEWGGVLRFEALTVEYETDWEPFKNDVNAFLFKGQLVDDLNLPVLFVDHIQSLGGQLNLDLFGDAARLVRRFVL